MIGVVDKLITGIETEVFEDNDTGRLFMDGFLKKSGIVRKSYQGCHSLEGNQSREFLRKLDQLESHFEEEDIDTQMKGLQFVEVLRSFSKVVSSCFGGYLSEEYLNNIIQFRTLYMQLGISVTPKVHCVFQHIHEFLNIANIGVSSGHKKGLGYFSEQSFEAMHHDAKQGWDRVKVGTNHAECGQRLKDFVVSNNSKHL